MATICLFTSSVFSQFTHDDATNLVLNTILADDIGNVDVYSSYNSFTTDIELIDNGSPANPYSESWVFFSNDNPFASWYHDSRIVFVSTVDGAYTVLNVEIYPKGLSSDYEEISTADRPDPIAMDGTPFITDPEKVASNYNYALIIVSMDNPRNWYNTSLIYNVLQDSYNYQADNIFVLYSWDGNSILGQNLDDEDPENDIDGPATPANIQTTITNLTTDLGHGDQLAVFFTGVPVNTNLSEPHLGLPIDANTIINYPVSDFSTVMENIDCGQTQL